MGDKGSLSRRSGRRGHQTGTGLGWEPPTSWDRLLVPFADGSGRAPPQLVCEQVLLAVATLHRPSFMPAGTLREQKPTTVLLPLTRAPQHPCTEGVPLPQHLVRLPLPSPHHWHLWVLCSTVRTQPFRNGAFAGSRATLTRKLFVSVSLFSCVPSRWKAPLPSRDRPPLCVCPRNALLSFRAAHSQITGQEPCVKAVQTRGFPHPRCDRLKYKHGVYRISGAMSFRVLRRLIVSPAERFV